MNLLSNPSKNVYDLLSFMSHTHSSRMYYHIDVYRKQYTLKKNSILMIH